MNLRTFVYKTVHVDEVEAYLARGWMVVLPSRPHPGGDAYCKIPMAWLCDCEHEVRR